jgi:hypothetical protein
MKIFEKNKNQTRENDKKTLGKTFLVALFIGIILILISIIINDILLVNIPCNSKISFFTTVINELIKNAGIAIIIAYFFTYISSTRSFIDFIKDRLISIIITKDFLNKLNKNEQRDILYATTQPSEELLSTYSGIKDYFNMHITKFLALSETHFRSSYQVDAVAKIDNTDNIVYVDSQLSYRMYKVAGEIENLNTGFEDMKFKEEPTKIYTPDRKEYPISQENIERDKLKTREMDVDFKNDPSLNSVSVPIINSDLKNELLKYNYLDVVKRVTEFGNDHWHLYTFRIIHPCDKFSISLSCQDNLIIKKTIPFGKIDSFIIDIRDNNRIITILCNEWLEAGSGVAILIAKA